MYYEKQERELHLKDIIFAVLRQWRKIFVLALVFAVLLGGMKAVSIRQENGKSVDLTAYYQELETYEQTKMNKQQDLAWIQEKATKQRVYMQESVLMSLDPTNMYRATMEIYISDADELLAQQMLDTYRAAINGGAFFEEAAAQMGMEGKYFRELLTVSTKERTIGEQTRQHVTVVINYKDQEGVSRILELVNQRLDDTVSQVTESFGSHNLVKVAGQAVKCVDMAGVGASQWEGKERLSQYESALNSAKKALKELKEPIKPGAPKNVVRPSVEFAVVGALLGCVLGAAWGLLMILFGDRLYSATDLQGRYNIKLLGVVAGGKKKCFVDRWLDTLEGRIAEDTAQNEALMAVNVRSQCADADSLLLCGDVEAAKQLATRIGTALSPMAVLEAGDPVKESDALERLQQAKAVALVGVCGKDRYSGLAKTMELIHNLDKDLIGCIIVEN